MKPAMQPSALLHRDDVIRAMVDQEHRLLDAARVRHWIPASKATERDQPFAHLGAEGAGRESAEVARDRVRHDASDPRVLRREQECERRATRLAHHADRSLRTDASSQGVIARVGVDKTEAVTPVVRSPGCDACRSPSADGGAVALECYPACLYEASAVEIEEDRGPALAKGASKSRWGTRGARLAVWVRLAEGMTTG